MLATLATPQTLRAAVGTAVTDGAWAPTDVIATVTSQVPATPSDVVATLWDLVADGNLVYDASASYPVFRPVAGR